MTALRVLGLLGAGYLGLAALMFFSQSRLVHLPHVPGRALVATPARIGLEYEEVSFHAEDGVALHGWYVPANNARAARAYLVEDRRIEPTRIVAFGRSLGGAVAACLAAELAVGALIVESGFTSVPDLGAELYPWLPVRWLARLQYDTRACVADVDVPVLIVHSPDDEIIPFRHGEALAAAARAELLRIRGDHNTGFLRSAEIYRRGLDRFLKSLDLTR